MNKKVIYRDEFYTPQKLVEIMKKACVIFYNPQYHAKHHNTKRRIDFV